MAPAGGQADGRGALLLVSASLCVYGSNCVNIYISCRALDVKSLTYDESNKYIHVF